MIKSSSEYSDAAWALIEEAATMPCPESIREPSHPRIWWLANNAQGANLTDDETRMMRRLISALSRLREQDQTMPVQQMLVLLWIAANEGRPQRDLIQAFKDIPESTVSRNVAALSEVHRLGKPGLGLVSWLPHPTDRRVNLLQLTPQRYLPAGQDRSDVTHRQEALIKSQTVKTTCTRFGRTEFSLPKPSGAAAPIGPSEKTPFRPPF